MRYAPGGGERGTSVVEFLIIGPLICLFFYAAVDLNERVEQKRTLRIASRNVAASGLSGDDSATRAQKVLKDEVLLGGGRAFEDPTTIGALTRSSDQRGIAVDGSLLKAQLDDIGYADAGRDSKGLPDGRLQAASGVDDGGYKTVSRVEGTFSRGGEYLDDLLNFKILGQSFLFLEDSPRIATVRLTTPGTSSLFKRGIGLLDRSIQRKNPDAQTFKNLGSDFAQRYYLRAEPGYHPNKYQHEGLLGFAIGTASSDAKQWGEPYKHEGGGLLGLLSSGIKDGYPAQCIANFTAGDKCTDTNWYSVIVIVVAEVRGVISLFHGGESGGDGFNSDAKFSGKMPGAGDGKKDSKDMASGFGSGVGTTLQDQLNGHTSGMGSSGLDPAALLKGQVLDKAGVSNGAFQQQIQPLQNAFGKESP